jgi:hypothetical protein
MELRFYRCVLCNRLEEERRLTSIGKCVCMSRKFSPVLATLLEATWFIIVHPSYLIRALRGEQ